MRATKSWVLISVFLPSMASVALGQDVAAPTGQQTLAATIGVYVFPAKGQTPEQQSQDEARCYSWAADNTKSDPFDLSKQAAQQQQQAEQQKEQIDDSRKGAGAKGAARGAVRGALIGEIVNDDPGKGAARGAAVGGVASRRKAKRRASNAKSEVDANTQQVQAATQEQTEGFKKAFSVCLEASDYLVKL